MQVFKPSADTRHEPEILVTRDNRVLSAVSVKDSTELREQLELGVQVVGVDEAQFFDMGLVDVVNDLADRGVRVIIAGLDLDYLRRPFGPMAELVAIAEYVDKVHAICVRCGGQAHYTQRTSGGGELVQVGDEEAYEARCRRCYEPFEPAREKAEAT